MRKLVCLRLVTLVAAVCLASLPIVAAASDPTIVAHVNGGGTGLFVPPSVTPTDMGITTNFAVGLTVYSDGSAKGHFTCLVPGFVVIVGLYDSASYDEVTGIATASGIGVVKLVNDITIPVCFTNTFKAGGPGVGIFTLSEDSGFFPVYPVDVDTEVVIKGKITIH